MLKNPLQYSISTLLVVTFLIAVGTTAGGAMWYVIAVVEFLLFCMVLNVLSENIPAVIEQQLKANAVRADGSRSSNREKIEKLERRRFKRNLSILLLVFLAASNLLMLTLRVDRLFEGETYVVKSPEVTLRVNRKTTESQYARELGIAQLKAEGVGGLEAASPGSVRTMFLFVFGAIWSLTLLLVPVGYLGMLRTLASEATDRSEFYRALDFRVYSASQSSS